MKFIYNGRIYNPVNVEKKLKKMRITMEDIEILPDEKKKEDNSLEDYMLDKKQIIVQLFYLPEIHSCIFSANILSEIPICSLNNAYSSFFSVVSILGITIPTSWR